jgi:XTP/dITP diphosphohydrolase
MLDALAGEAAREARYVCALVAIDPDGREVVSRGTLDGTIARVASGSEGFGFDPIFVPEGETETVAVLGDDWKETHSHRARAARVLADLLGT